MFKLVCFLNTSLNDCKITKTGQLKQCNLSQRRVTIKGEKKEIKLNRWQNKTITIIFLLIAIVNLNTKCYIIFKISLCNIIYIITSVKKYLNLLIF